MTTREDAKAKLEEALESLDLTDCELTVEFDDRHRLVAVVTTPDFEGVDEAERQSQVWEVVYDQLDDEEQVLVDFIFTNTPDEEDEIEDREKNGDEKVML